MIYNNPPTHKVLAHKTMLITFLCKGKDIPEVFTAIIPNSIINLEMIDQSIANIIIQTDRLGQFINLVKDKELMDVIVEVTDDPTPVAAGGVVSLGYYVLRIGISKPKIMSVTPLVVSGDKKTMQIKKTKEMRERKVNTPTIFGKTTSALVIQPNEALTKINQYEAFIWLYRPETNEACYVLHSRYSKHPLFAQIDVTFEEFTTIFVDDVLVETITCNSLEQVKEEEINLINKYMKVK